MSTEGLNKKRRKIIFEVKNQSSFARQHDQTEILKLVYNNIINTSKNSWVLGKEFELMCPQKLNSYSNFWDAPHLLIFISKLFNRCS
ncbi:hypothetical protein CR203_24795 [Salipaludibacillus neizhouensis]|uniref:Uncharacterized protein n=1 Tax=Salipaludibacillus neizhouensis TaxID=885475 RepID=A0A3A9KID5_9BACI|nr:hypothetical protein CR203_24795 [Salipaludibacillus neizhouensis]